MMESRHFLYEHSHGWAEHTCNAYSQNRPPLPSQQDNYVVLSIPIPIQEGTQLCRGSAFWNNIVVIHYPVRTGLS